MSKRLDKSWVVLASLENPEANRCVDLFVRPDQTHGFEEFRRDPEDSGAWMQNSVQNFPDYGVRPCGWTELTTTAVYANAVGAEEQSIAARMW
jgi:hypothetical protein